MNQSACAQCYFLTVSEEMLQTLIISMENRYFIISLKEKKLLYCVIINLLAEKKVSDFVKYYKPRDLNLVLENEVNILRLMQAFITS